MSDDLGGDSYLTFARESAGLFKDRGSKFHFFGFPVGSEEEIRLKLLNLKKVHFDASHHCYAWMLGKDGTHFRANDDGEPNHSAGDPILGKIRSFQLTNVLIVVVRYFGGTKLGVSGLIQAYKTSAQMAIESNEITNHFLLDQIRLNFPYSAMNEVMKLVKGLNMDIVEQNMNLNCEMVLSFRAGLKQEVENRIQDMESVVLLRG
ncbi:YigZ family protein [Algoriphagus confluentis]|uniref:YigZ family protein n=1 Tax=Algoriphagus confluentis TaxID=1697556 RepID=A0ABQ6PRB7_9BACT|nr:YigZ family protein [Algoriphagus confluentis]